MIKLNNSYQILLALCLFMALSNYLSAQRNTQYTQFMPNKLWINPAYAGSYNLGVVTGIAREQWVGLDGAPSSQGLSFHTPLANNRVGLGMNLSYDEIGPTNSLFISTQYAYRIPLKKGTLALGANASVGRNRIDFNLLQGIQINDLNIPGNVESATNFNFGVGTYYQSDKFFAGISLPFILRDDLQVVDNQQQALTYSEQDASLYAMAGFVFQISEKVAAKPSILLKYDRNSPVDFDIHGSLIFFDRLWTGLSYRVGTGDIYTSESIDLVVQYQFTDALRMGLAYDYTLTNLQTTQDGTFELLLQYAFEIKYKKRDKTSESITNPRFF